MHQDRNTASNARGLFYTAPKVVELRPVKIENSQTPPPGHVAVKTAWSAISRGTERLIFEGRVPLTEYARMRAPMQDGVFPFPVKYGYAAVGHVTAGPDDLLNRAVFALHPHQDMFIAPIDQITAIPDPIPVKRAVLAASMETALNAIWDGAPSVGEKIVIVGAGAIGLLITSLAARLPAANVIVIDENPARRDVAQLFGAAFHTPDEIAAHELEADIVFHTSASSEGLNLALAAAGCEARIVELSWYGDASVSIPLGHAFHTKRLQLVSSQVSMIAPTMRTRWTRARRLSTAMSLLEDARLDALLTGEVAFEDLSQKMSSIFSSHDASIVTAVRYQSRESAS